MKRVRQSKLSRRRFIRSGLIVAGLTGIQAARAAGKGTPNPFAYDVSAHEKTDPKLIRYREVTRFKVPRENSRRLSLAGEGRLAVAAGNSVLLLDDQGQLTSEIALQAPVRAVTMAGDGTLFVAVRDHVEVFDGQGQRQATWESPGKKTWFTGLAVNEANVFAADSGQRVVLRYDRAGHVQGRIGERDKARGIPGFVLPSPYLDVKWHQDGLLRVNNPGRHRIEVYTPEGDLEFSWGRASFAVQGFCGCCNPIAFALTSDGRHITCEKGLPRVKRYTGGGEFDGVVAGPESFPENARVGAGETLADGTKSSLDAVVDARGRVFVLDTVVGDIRVHAPNEEGKV